MMRRRKLLLLLLVLQFFSRSPAQLCQGSLGEPIVNITFGAGGNPGNPLPGATTNYQYTTTDCPSDGFYTVRNRTENCFSGWHVLGADHTGNSNGYFMLVNASQQPSAFYVDTVNLLCSNTTYEFAAWVINMNTVSECNGAPRQPNLTFTIERTDGTLLQSFTTGNIPPQSTAVWRQYGFFFSTPTNINSIVLRITNNAPGGCGNDLALDDITFRPCGPLITPTIDGSTTLKNLCEGEGGQAVLNGNLSAGFSNPVFQWQESMNNGITWIDIPGATAQNLLRTFPANAPVGAYLYRLSVSKAENSAVQLCRVNSTSLTIKVNKKPTTTLTNNSPVCEGSVAQLQATGGTQYVWSGVNGFASSGEIVNIPSAQLLQTGRYYVRVTNNEGCFKIDSTDILVNPTPVAAILNPNSSICEDDSVQLFASGGGTYLWKPRVGLSSASIPNPFASPKDSTQYQLIITNSFGCSDTAFAGVNIHKKPRAFAGPDKSIVEGQKIQLTGRITGTNISYQWSPPDFITNVNSLTTFVNPVADTKYVLTAVSNEGCGVATDTVLIKVFKGIFIPSAFTPNDDGKNDVWSVVGLTVYQDYEILVFNRYGEMVFKSRNADDGWDGKHKGKRVPNGVYAYLIKVKDVSLVRSGLVTVVR